MIEFAIHALLTRCSRVLTHGAILLDIKPSLPRFRCIPPARLSLSIERYRKGAQHALVARPAENPMALGPRSKCQPDQHHGGFIIIITVTLMRPHTIDHRGYIPKMHLAQIAGMFFMIWCCRADCQPPASVFFCSEPAKNGSGEDRNLARTPMGNQDALPLRLVASMVTVFQKPKLIGPTCGSLKKLASPPFIPKTMDSGSRKPHSPKPRDTSLAYGSPPLCYSSCMTVRNSPLLQPSLFFADEQ